MNLSELIYSIKEEPNKKMMNDEIVQFIGYCITHAHQSKSQNYQDIWALWETNKVESHNKFFVEFGATDGLTSSNTYLLEKYYGWKGILAEPNPTWHADLNDNRSCNITHDCIFDVTGGQVEFLMTEAADLATIKGFGADDQFKEERKKSEVIKVNTITLLDLLNRYDAPNVIDYMSVDTEGSEYGILNTFFNQNNNKYIIRTLTIEHNFTMRDKILGLMTSNGYERKFTDISRWDDFYVKVS